MSAPVPPPVPAAAPALSRLSLGGATFGREIGREAAFQLMDHAAARGITHFDTAANYSQGVSEQIVGAWLASRRPAARTLSVATKIYPPFTPAAIDAAVAVSARHLGVATIDLLYLHRWDEAALVVDSLRTLDNLVRSGRVRALGVSNFTAAQLRELLNRQLELGLAPVRVIQNNHNLAIREVDAALAQLCGAHNIAIVTYSPLGAGFLTGKHRDGVQAGSRFAVMPGHQQVYFTPTATRRFAKLAEVAERTGRSMTHLALAWALHQPQVASVLIGGRTTAHLDQAFDALEFNDPALLADLNSA